MKKILVAMLIATMMLLALCSADDVTKTTSTTSATPGFEATFAITGILAVAFLALRRRS